MKYNLGNANQLTQRCFCEIFKCILYLILIGSFTYYQLEKLNSLFAQVHPTGQVNLALRYSMLIVNNISNVDVFISH